VPTTSLHDALRGVESELASGRPSEALRRCEQLLGTHPHWLEAQRVQAESLIALERLSEAERVLDSVLSCHPEHVRAFYDRAYLAQRRGNLLGALACYRRACELTANNAQLRAMYNQMAAQLRRPPYTPSHTGLARLYLRCELFPQALREWNAALHANPQRIDAQVGMAETLWRMGDARHAQSVCRYILQQMPYCLKPLLLLALFEIDAQHIEEASRLIKQAAELDPDQIVARELFADIVATGHAALAQLFREYARSLTTPLGGSGVTTGQTGVFSASTSGMQRPITTPLPDGKLPTGPLFKTTILSPGESKPTGKLERPFPPDGQNGHQGDAGKMEDFFSRSRASVVPADFQQVFKETEYMLWSRDEDTTSSEIVPAGSRGAGAAPSAPTTDQTTADGDDFVRWLQEQGARPLDAGYEEMPAASSPRGGSADLADQQTGELPAFIAQAYEEGAAPAGNQEFAAEDRVPAQEFGEPESSPIALGPMPESPASEAWAPGDADSDEPAGAALEMDTMELPAATPTGEEETTAHLPTVTPPAPEPDTNADATVFPDDRAALPSLAGHPGESMSPADYVTSMPAIHAISSPEIPIDRDAQPDDGEAPALTIEAIEHGLQSAGYAHLDTGRLASVATTLDSVPDDSAPSEQDFASRLANARALRASGRMGEALAEYRALVKAAIDEIPEIIRDLRDAAIEDPHEAEVYRLLGDAHIRLGDYVEALEAYNRGNALRQEQGE
jgi:tetratricopeptide (TPR) repeat protein